ncbi:hypothetical protein F5Y16DRAFT_158821 [Xylariaceae sp. FL0255]|nr:hypothetical protein F5Y16DRAFT_158821 [Xylariaceae sp. FL0255]
MSFTHHNADTSPWRASTAYANIFRSRPEARKTQKRSSSLRNGSIISTQHEKPAVDVTDNSHATHNTTTKAGSSEPFSSVHHQRSRSASAVTPQYGYNRGVLSKPATSRASGEIWNNHRHDLDFDICGRPPQIDNHVAMSRSAYTPTAMASAQHAQRPTRRPSANMSNYAQIDSQSTIYQRRPPTSSSMASSFSGNDTFDAILTSPTSSRTSFDSWHSISQRPNQGYQRPAPLKQNRRRREEGELFAALPDEVLGLILARLRDLHLQPSGSSCATCMMRDLCSISLSAKKLLKAARIALYDDIQLVGADSPAQKKRLKLAFGSRLVLLRRTLRARPDLAVLVRNLKVPATPQGVARDLYRNLVATVVMACPNLERLLGFHQSYNFAFDRLFQALSTREQLTSMHWTLEASTSQRKRRMSNAAPMLSSGKPDFREAPGDLQPEQSEEFREMHLNWMNLTSLSIHCLAGATLTPVSLLPDILADIPSLQDLHLTHLPFTAFNDANLLSLPPLLTLTLSHLPGVSSEGLSSFARRPSSRAIRKLTLHHVDVDSLATLSQILSNLISLETFALVQSQIPMLPENETVWLFPYLASPTVKRLHWDMPGFASTANVADSILAKSIATNGFPALESLRTPWDPEGIFQALCKPMEKADLASDKYRGLIAMAGSSRPKSPPQTPTTPTTPRTPGKSPFALNFPAADDLFATKQCSNLAESRVGAQQRIEAARDHARFTFNLIAENGQLLETKKMAGFMGETSSRINYCLTPDAGARDESGGLVEIGDFLGDCGENVNSAGRDGCTGRWNTYSGNVVDKKDRERWFHTERGRWAAVEL